MFDGWLNTKVNMLPSTIAIPPSIVTSGGNVGGGGGGGTIKCKYNIYHTNTLIHYHSKCPSLLSMAWLYPDIRKAFIFIIKRISNHSNVIL